MNRTSVAFIVTTLFLSWLYLNANAGIDGLIQQELQVTSESLKKPADQVQPESKRLGLGADTPDERLNRPEDLIQGQIAELYRATFPNGDMSQRRQMLLEDEWCVPHEDLKIEEYHEYLAQLDNWLLDRGHVDLVNRGGIPSEKFQRNKDFIAPYEELAADALIQHANNNDKVALSVLMQREDFGTHQRTQAAKQLLLLGDSSKALSQLMMDELSKLEKLQKEGDSRQAIRAIFIKSLALARYGLLRYDTTALMTLSSQLPILMPDSDLASFVRAEDEKLISAVTDKMLTSLNTAREDLNLPPIHFEPPPKVPYTNFQRHIITLLSQESSLFGQPWFPIGWQEEFIPNTPCFERLQRVDKFWNQQVPALQDASLHP